MSKIGDCELTSEENLSLEVDRQYWRVCVSCCSSRTRVNRLHGRGPIALDTRRLLHEPGNQEDHCDRAFALTFLLA
jgi:hypothetical protein